MSSATALPVPIRAKRASRPRTDRISPPAALLGDAPDASGSSTLYVDADTYKPIEQVVVYRYDHGRTVITDRISLRPATAANVARAAARPNLTGYKRR